MNSQAPTVFAPHGPMTEITQGPTLSLNGLMRLEEIPRVIIITPVEILPPPVIETRWRKLWRVLNMDVKEVWRLLLERWRRH